MKFGSYEIKPIGIYLPDDPDWVIRDNEGKRYFKSQGIEDICWIAGVHAVRWGIQGRHIYLLDQNYSEQFYIGDAKVGSFLSQYVIYSCMNVMPDSHFIFLETDCRFELGWKEKLEQALKDIPSDFDFLFCGHCCTEDKLPIHVKGDLYHFPYRGEAMWQYFPQGAHFMIIAKKCVQHLINTQRDVATPADISLIRHSFKDLNVYAIIPRIANQGNTVLPL